ncbi:hypothetical protein FQR65_LT08370 [Abscondita terminalis]|nr:hypothetical protein FQR65_LT08370 [Abscondita terminalis]
MVRCAVADDSFLNYFASFCKSDLPTIGLILGQPTPSKYYLIHFARTPSHNEDTEEQNPVKSFSDISNVWVADHARHATRMLPGGMYVLGIFVVFSENLFEVFSLKLKSILVEINKTLGNNKFLHGVPVENSDKLILCYSSSNKSFVSKSYNFESGLISIVDMKFEPHLSVKWLQLECIYELDQTFPIIAAKENWSFKKHMNDILKFISTSLKHGIFFFDGEVKDESDCLESIGKKRKVPQAKFVQHDTKLLQVTIILPNEMLLSKSDAEIIDCGGQIRLTGHVATKLWLHPKATIKDASSAIIEDIERSLATRLEMHWDSLIEEERGLLEGLNSVHEIPRRVSVNLPVSKINLYDYLFPGEGPQEAQVSLKELLDIDVSGTNCIFDVESQADVMDLHRDTIKTDTEDILQTTNKFIYFVGLGIAFIVLIISLLIHKIQN